MTLINKIIAVLFGTSFLILALLIVIETLSRKFLNVSLQGVDELSGYVLAFTATLAFSSALISKNHMRIDILYRRYPLILKNILNMVALLSITSFACYLAYINFQVVIETHSYKSTAPTPWATPLIIPQGFWLAASIIFVLVSIIKVIEAIRLIMLQKYDQLEQNFGPKGTNDEVKEELESFSKRNELGENK